METLTKEERKNLTRLLNQRKGRMREEIHAGLARLRAEGREAHLSGTTDVGDEALAALMLDVANAEVARDAGELQDILAAEARLAAGSYGVCIDCDAPIPYARLAAYPTAKRCLHCQQIREATRATPRRR